MRVNHHLFYSDDMQNLNLKKSVFSNVVSASIQINAMAQKQTLKFERCQLIFKQKMCIADNCTENMYNSIVWKLNRS